MYKTLNRPIFANEFGKIYIRRNGYMEKVWEENLTKLKNDSYLMEAPILKLEETPKNNMTNDDYDTEYFSYESD